MQLADLGKNSELIKKVNANAPLTFYLDDIAMSASYPDELSAHRARKVWRDILIRVYLLEDESDYRLEVVKDADKFALVCDFISSCGHYAFWRLSHKQASHVEEELCLAHLPTVNSSPEEFSLNVDLGQDSGSTVGKKYAIDSVSTKIKSAVESISKLVDSFLNR